MTIKRLLLDTAARHGNRAALRWKEEGSWRRATYAELLERSRDVAALLHARGIGPGDRVAILLDNGPRWPEIYFGIVGLGATAVPVDPKLREQEAAHILRDSGSRAVLLSGRLLPLMSEIDGRLPALETAIVLDGGPAAPGTGGCSYVPFDQAVAEARRASAGSAARAGAFELADPQPGDLASIIYTSGTTGRQKGAMLTHANFCSNVDASRQGIGVTEEDRFLLVLPLHHAFAFTANLLLPVLVGGEIAFVESLKTVGQNMREVSPTVLMAVPLLAEKLLRRIQEGVRRKPLARMCSRLGLRSVIRKGVLRQLGGRLRVIVVGGAACPMHVHLGFRELGILCLEGYGLTETAPVLTVNPWDAPRPGTIGRPVAGVELRIDEPDAEGIGEIVARGPNIMRGYLNHPEATEDVLRDGWFRTGDLGRVDEDGYVTITGRKKSLIVNREGKNIYPEEVEACLNAGPFVLESLVMGYTEAGETGERVGAIVVADQVALDEEACRRGASLDEKAIEELLVAEVKRSARDLAAYKRPRRILVRHEEFQKTSTAKVKRYLYNLG